MVSILCVLLTISGERNRQATTAKYIKICQRTESISIVTLVHILKSKALEPLKSCGCSTKFHQEFRFWSFLPSSFFFFFPSWKPLSRLQPCRIPQLISRSTGQALHWRTLSAASPLMGATQAHQDLKLSLLDLDSAASLAPSNADSVAWTSQSSKYTRRQGRRET